MNNFNVENIFQPGDLVRWKVHLGVTRVTDLVGIILSTTMVSSAWRKEGKDPMYLVLWNDFQLERLPIGWLEKIT